MAHSLISVRSLAHTCAFLIHKSPKFGPEIPKFFVGRIKWNESIPIFSGEEENRCSAGIRYSFTPNRIQEQFLHLYDDEGLLEDKMKNHRLINKIENESRPSAQMAPLLLAPDLSPSHMALLPPNLSDIMRL